MELVIMFSITLIFYYILGCLFNIKLWVHKAGEYMRSYMDKTRHLGIPVHLHLNAELRPTLELSSALGVDDAIGNFCFSKLSF